MSEAKAPDRAPPLVLAYGPPGAGKTTDMIYSFPHALFICAPGSTKSGVNLIGHTPEPYNIQDLAAVTAYLPQVKKAGYRQVVIDDLSAIAEKTEAICKATYKGWAVSNNIRRIMSEFRETVRYLDLTVACNAWESAPKVKETTPKDKEGNIRPGAEETYVKTKGGPKLPMDFAEGLPALFDNVYRAKPPPESAKGNRWQGTYLTRGDDDYVAKDRDAMTPVVAPMNLGQILRFSGYELPYMYDWQAEQVQRVCGLFGDVKDDAKVAQGAYSELLGAGLDPRQARWVVRDAYDLKKLIREDELRQTNFW